MLIKKKKPKKKKKIEIKKKFTAWVSFCMCQYHDAGLYAAVLISKSVDQVVKHGPRAEANSITLKLKIFSTFFNVPMLKLLNCEVNTVQLTLTKVS